VYPHPCSVHLRHAPVLEVLIIHGLMSKKISWRLWGIDPGCEISAWWHRQRLLVACADRREGGGDWILCALLLACGPFGPPWKGPPLALRILGYKHDRRTFLCAFPHLQEVFHVLDPGWCSADPQWVKRERCAFPRSTSLTPIGDEPELFMLLWKSFD